jgi:ABC-type nitrate/sulfonate/bicarbonate transport system permease component
MRTVVAVLTFLALWYAAALLADSPLLVPSPMLVWGGLVDLWDRGELVGHIQASLTRLFVGLALGVPLGVLFGCAAGRWELIDAVLNPFVRMFNAIPAISLVPFTLIWLGVTEASRFALLTYTVTLTVLLSAREGVKAVPRLRMRAAETLGVVGVAAFFRVVIPSCFPAILAGIRTALGLGVMVIVAAEMIGADNGLGYLIMQARSQFNVSHMLVGILGLGLLSLTLDRAFQYSIENFFPRWSQKRRV